MTSSQVRAVFFAPPVSLAMVLLVSTGFAAGELAGQPFPADLPTDVTADETQPAGLPVLIEITLTNTGKTTVSYWCGGPDRYPGAHEFSARVTDDRGKTRAVGLANGQYVMGSGVYRPIEPGEFVILPATLESLPAGSYTIRVGKGKSAKVVVKDDPMLVRAREQDILKRIRHGEPFAQHVARIFAGDTLTRGLLQDLLSEDQQLALHAVRTLQGVKRLPPNAGAIVQKSIRMHLDTTETKQNLQSYLLRDLAGVAGKIGTDEAMSGVLAIVHSKMGAETRGAAISFLGMFKQEQAAKVLHDLLKDKNERVSYEAARTLAYRKDPAAIDFLLALAADREHRWRAEAYVLLANFPADERVEPVLKKGLTDSNIFVRSHAEQALRELKRNQKR